LSPEIIGGHKDLFFTEFWEQGLSLVLIPTQHPAKPEVVLLLVFRPRGYPQAFSRRKSLGLP
jgi:hypothetical protein